ncbi:MAG: proton-conducting transporter membrane subunit, partial [Phycisphaeraceae bacterium]
HLTGGMCLLAGIIIHLAAGGELITGPIGWDSPGGMLLITGMAINAAIVPLHAWLPDGYPRGTLFGTVLISAFTTKASIYALTRSFAGTELLVYAGCFMAIYGVVFAIMENNLRRLLSYHIVSQVGFMVAAIGMAVAGSKGEAYAVNGATLHAINNVFYKGLLLMTVGAIIYTTGTAKLTELGGLGKRLKWTMIFFIIGALSIAGAPLFNGFISKAFILSAAGYNHWGGVEIALLAASMGTFLSVGLKIMYFAFLGKEKTPITRDVPLPMLLAMASASAVCLAIGVLPTTFYTLLPFETDYNAYTGDHVIHSLQLLIATALGFWILRAKLKTKDLVTRDVDRLYRGPLWGAVQGTGMILAHLGEGVRAVGQAVIQVGMTVLNFYYCVRWQS